MSDFDPAYEPSIRIECEVCGGSGIEQLPDFQTADCSYCNGNGYIEYTP